MRLIRSQLWLASGCLELPAGALPLDPAGEDASSPDPSGPAWERETPGRPASPVPKPVAIRHRYRSADMGE